MTIEELENAKRRALGILDQWIDVTGVINKRSPYYRELQEVVIDAVYCGAQAATGITEPLEGECKVSESCESDIPQEESC